MEDLIQRLKKWNKKPHSQHAHKKGVVEAPPTTLDLDLASPTDSESMKIQTKTSAKFQLKRPRWSSNDEKLSRKGASVTRYEKSKVDHIEFLTKCAFYLQKICDLGTTVSTFS